MTSDREQGSEDVKGGRATATAATAVAMAANTIHQLCAQLRCDACEAGLVSNARPWRSCNCEHRLCANCAAAARGTAATDAADTDGIQPSTRGRASSSRSGFCPVRSCQIPVRPSEIVHDLAAWHIVLACNALDDWARQSQQTVPNVVHLD